MKRKSFSRLLFTISLLIIFFTIGCSQATKKRLVTVEDELSKAQARVSTLENEKAQLEQSLTETKKALDEVKAQNGKLQTDLNSLKARLADLEKEKNDLIAASQKAEVDSSKKVKALNNLIARLRAEAKEKEADIQAKNSEIENLKASEAALKQSDEQNKARIASLNKDMADLTEKMNNEIAKKKRTITILGILLAVAVILAIIGFARKRKVVSS
ncbi:MAG: hypothetical protein NUW07_06230 [Candidatus Saccharicenans sp.]|nr:hypothetical protein [Candidatus Saccharicenans sp.]MDH7494219.1 hypothetical protein [Candidatus Saccharicenans sp.]